MKGLIIIDYSKYKTIKQIADEIGVSKQAVHKKIKKEPLASTLQEFISTVDGVVYIEVDGESLIKSTFTQKYVSTEIEKNSELAATVNEFTTTADELTVTVDNAVDDIKIEYIGSLKEQISSLQQQLQIKDKQLESKDVQLNEQQQTIKELTGTIRIQAESINAAHHNELAETIIDGQTTMPTLPDKKQEKHPFWQFWKKRQ